MPLAPHLVRRSAMYNWRRKLPQALATFQNRQHAMESLCTRDPVRARKLAVRRDALFEEIVMLSACFLTARQDVRADDDDPLRELDLPTEFAERQPRSWKNWEVHVFAGDLRSITFPYTDWPKLSNGHASLANQNLTAISHLRSGRSYQLHRLPTRAPLCCKSALTAAPFLRRPQSFEGSQKNTFRSEVSIGANRDSRDQPNSVDRSERSERFGWGFSDCSDSHPACRFSSASAVTLEQTQTLASSPTELSHIGLTGFSEPCSDGQQAICLR